MFEFWIGNSDIAKQIGYIMSETPQAVWDTLYSTILSTFFACVIGLPLGVLLVAGVEDGVRPLPKPLMSALNIIVNLLRSVPFLILMVVVFPISRIVVGTTVGTMATIVPLTIAAFPFVARLVESSLKEIDNGVVEAAQAMGCSPFQIIWKVILPECLPSLISGITTAFITIMGYGAMSGNIGGGGLGKLALNLGFTRNYRLVLWWAVVLLVILVQIFQTAGTYLSTRLDHRITGQKQSKAKGMRNSGKSEAI